MQERKRVYPGEKTPAKGLSYLLLFLSAVILFSGLAARGDDRPVLEAAATATPIPLDEAFDETRETREIVVEGKSWYALQLGAFGEESSAQTLASRFQTRGAAGYVWQDERYRVLAAAYSDKDDAQAVRQQLREAHKVDSYLFEISLPSLVLRMTGMRGQIDVLEAAFLHAEELLSELRRASDDLDRLETNVSETLNELNALRERLDLVALRLEQRFPKPRNVAAEQLLLLFQDYSRFVAEQNETQSSARLGQQIKYQLLRSLFLQKQLTDALKQS